MLGENESRRERVIRKGDEEEEKIRIKERRPGERNRSQRVTRKRASSIINGGREMGREEKDWEMKGERD